MTAPLKTHTPRGLCLMGEPQRKEKQMVDYIVDGPPGWHPGKIGDPPYTPAWPYPNQPYVPTVTTTGTTIYAGPSRAEFDALQQRVGELIARFDTLTAPPHAPLRSDDV